MAALKHDGLRVTRKARAALTRAEMQLHTALRREMPVGASVVYTHGPHLICVTIVGHDYGHRVRVRNGTSGREYWIDSYRVTRVTRLPAVDR